MFPGYTWNLRTIANPTAPDSKVRATCTSLVAQTLDS
jgi:hypothetical protein